jgi:dipeptidyl aminopeptidase/acylaminoacyl peptidase
MRKVMILVLFELVAAILSAGDAPAPGGRSGSAPASLIPREILFGNPTRALPQISPDGNRLAYLSPSDKGVMNVWIRPLDREDSIQVTQEPQHGIRQFFWALDGEGILYLQDTQGDENFHVFHADLQTKVTRDLTPFRGIRAVNLLLRPSGILVGLNIRNRALFDMYAIDLKTGAVRLDTENPGDVIFLVGNEWIADASGEIRAVRALDLKDGSTILRARDRAGEPWRELARWPSGGIFDGDIAGFAGDGRSIVVTSGAGSDTAGLVRLDARTGRAIEVLARDPRCDLWSGDTLLHPVTRSLQAFAVNYLKREWKTPDPEIAADFRILESAREGFFRIVSRDNADSKWVVSYEIPDGPVSYSVYDRKTKSVRFMFDDRPELKDRVLAPMKPILLEARDGLKLVSYLTIPAGRKPENLPLVLYVHGGPTARDEWAYDSVVQLLANRGYAVLQVNFRGSVGFGNAFQRAGDGQMGVGSMQHDLTDAVRWAVREGIADPRRIGIAGVSYGGYATLAGLAFTPELYACGAEICGPANIKTLLESIPPYLGPLKKLFLRIFGDGENDSAYNQRISPLFHVERIRVPLLVGQGANDPRCPIRESDRIVRAMRERNLPVTYVVYADEGHGFKRPANNLDFFGRLEEFLAKHLGGEYEPARKVEGSTAELR